jgi:energy-coupling factor transporter transmembrane protein EcfT
MMITMTLRFISTMKKRLNRISRPSPLWHFTSKGSLGKKLSSGKYFVCSGFRIIRRHIDTADSMKARGYGIKVKLIIIPIFIPSEISFCL